MSVQILHIWCLGHPYLILVDVHLPTSHTLYVILLLSLVQGFSGLEAYDL